MTRKFDESVTDEDLKKLPVMQFEGRVKLVDNMQNQPVQNTRIRHRDKTFI
jgi:hypothetical protein